MTKVLGALSKKTKLLIKGNTCTGIPIKTDNSGKKFEDIISYKDMEVEDCQSGRIVVMKLVWIDLDLYKDLARKVYTVKNAKTSATNFMNSLDVNLVSMRHIMYYMTKLRNVMRINVNEPGFVPLIDVFDTDPSNGKSIWGYKKVEQIDGCHERNICVPADCISETWSE
jgi:hypothetical protein